MQQNARFLVATSNTPGLARYAAVMSLALLLGCAGSNAKQVPSRGEGGEGGGGAAAETGASAVDAGAPAESAAGGVGEVGQGSAGERAVAGAGASDDTPDGGDDSSGGAAGEDGAGSVGGAAGTDAGADPTAGAGAGGADSGPIVPVSACGPGKWFPGEGQCLECPTENQVFELTCADYASAVVLLTTSGKLQYAYASLPAGVQAYEGKPVALSITYLAPEESHPRVLSFNGGGWSVDLKQAPEPPETLIVPPFSTADVCGNVFHSLEPVSFDRQPDASYVKVCP
jgi:hypothetical protein